MRCEGALSEKERYKKQIYDTLSPRRRKFIDRIGYDKWEPFQEPKDPLEMRMDSTKRTTQQLVREFLQECKPDNYSNAYGQGVMDICLGVVNGDERYRAMFDFALWYKDLLEKENAQFGRDEVTY